MSPETARRMGLLVVSRLAKPARPHGVAGPQHARRHHGDRAAAARAAPRPPAASRPARRCAPTPTGGRRAQGRPARSRWPSASPTSGSGRAFPSRSSRPRPRRPRRPRPDGAGGRGRLDRGCDQRRDPAAPAPARCLTVTGAMPGAPTGPTGGSLFQRPKANGNGTGPVAAEEPAAPAAEVDTPTRSRRRCRGETPEVEASEARPRPRSRRRPSSRSWPPRSEDARRRGADRRARAGRRRWRRPRSRVADRRSSARGSRRCADALAAPRRRPSRACRGQLDGRGVGQRHPGTAAGPGHRLRPRSTRAARCPRRPRTRRRSSATCGPTGSAPTDTGGTWTTSEIEAGWEAAEQVAEAPALQLSESGLPIRRPGKRLVPGGVTPPAAAVATRDPEAIRARLAAHAAGVSRGRTAAVDESDHAPSTEEGPA